MKSLPLINFFFFQFLLESTNKGNCEVGGVQKVVDILDVLYTSSCYRLWEVGDQTRCCCDRNEHSFYQSCVWLSSRCVRSVMICLMIYN